MNANSIDVKGKKKKNKRNKGPSIYSYLGGEKKWIFPGILVAALNGAILPIFGLCLGGVLDVLSRFSLYED